MRHLVPLLASRGLPCRTKGTSYFAIAYSAILSGNETWPITEEDVIKLKRNDANKVRWIWDFKPEERISDKRFRNILKLNNTRECL